MTDSARMLAQCVERQQKYAPNVLEAQARGVEDSSWQVGDVFIAQTDRGIEGFHDLPPDVVMDITGVPVLQGPGDLPPQILPDCG